tara:strand:+ start:11225 stop:11638 length:414 start_codon:yes stop_codon:yes gene_type:complete
MIKNFLIFLMLSLLVTNCSTIGGFGFGKKKNQFEKLKINEFLWKASNNLLINYPNVTSDLKDGYVSTDWIILKKNSKNRFKITVYILGSDLIEENLEIFVTKEVLKDGFWKKGQASSSFSDSLKKNIILRAKKLKSE